VSDAASKRKAKTKQAAPTSAKTVKGEVNTDGATKESSEVNAKTRKHSDSESRLS